MHFSPRHFKSILLAVFTLIFGGILLSFSKQLALSDTNYNFIGKKEKIELDPQEPIIQNFTANRDGLSGIRIAFGNASLSPGESIRFDLADTSCNVVLASDTYTIISPSPHTFYAFLFDRIPTSQGQTYCLKITYNSTLHKENRPTLSTIKGPDFGQSSFTNIASGKIYSGKSLQIRPVYTSKSFSETSSEFLNRLSQYKPSFFKDTSLVIILVTFIVSTFILTSLLILL